MELAPIKYNRFKLEILDQLKLPGESVYISIRTLEDVWKAIRNMQVIENLWWWSFIFLVYLNKRSFSKKVRGAPAISIAACLTLTNQLTKEKFTDKKDVEKFMHKSIDYLLTSRPTAVNLKNDTDKLIRVVESCMKNSNINIQYMLTRLQNLMVDISAYIL